MAVWRSIQGADRVTAFPVRPAAYIRDAYADTADDADLALLSDKVSSLAQDVLGWPVPVVYAEVGQPGSQLAALVEAITAGGHDGVFATYPSQLGDDLGQIEAFDRLCRQHGVDLRFRWCETVTDARALFDVVDRVGEFTVTGEHLRLLRRAYVSWEEGEFLGAPSIDSKRPYGNSDIYRDIAEILDVPESEWADEDFNPSPDAEWRFLRLHVETAVALQVALATGEFRTGRYVREDDESGSDRWRRDDA
jgi:hypothetical protein